MEMPPNPDNLISSMRDIGYTLGTALADVIDNSITAGARSIDLFMESNGTERRIAIIDDGSGMTRDTLIEAMVFASQHPDDKREEKDLGRFGLGLKTAAVSQCRRLTVVTMRDSVASAARWDLDVISETAKWSLDEWQPGDGTERPWMMEQLGTHGTLVLFENLDRLVTDDGSSIDDAEFERRMSEASAHLELVFHRFLSGEPGQARIKMSANGIAFEPFDPFNKNNPATIKHPSESFRLGGELIWFQGFTLPHQSKVSPAEYEKYATIEGYQSTQGFYVYRGKRLIIHGTWFGLTKALPLTNLARIQIDIPNGLDSKWKINVMKSTAELPPQVKRRLRALIATIKGPSVDVHVGTTVRLAEQNRLPVWNRDKKPDGSIYYRPNENHPVLLEYLSNLPDDRKEGFHDILEFVGSTLPMPLLFVDLANDAEQVSENDTDPDVFERKAIDTYKVLAENLQRGEILTMMQAAEPFSSRWETTLKIIDSID
jgi:hypothetical protein